MTLTAEYHSSFACTAHGRK